jgi:hypothetical protein
MPDRRGGYLSPATPVGQLPKVSPGPAAGASLPAGRRGATDHAREVTLVAEALCDCSQSYGRHAVRCASVRARNFGRLDAALSEHDRRVLADAEEFCSSCGEALDPGNLCRVNGVPYHLGNCPRPHGAP